MGQFDLDPSPAVFGKLEDLEKGRVRIGWEFVDQAKVRMGPFKGAGSEMGKGSGGKGKKAEDSEVCRECERLRKKGRDEL